MAVMKASEFVKRLRDVAENYKTLYVMGCFGAPLNSANKERYCNNHDYNKKAARTKMIKAASEDTFGFDCVCLIKGILWGWNGNKNKTYGGAGYAVNGVPDIGADSMIKVCSDLSTNFNDIEVGEAVWTTGHIGVYIGDGLAVECTPAWKNKVQITACNRSVAGYNRRNWKKHGKLPYIEYDVKQEQAGSNAQVGTSLDFSVGDTVKFVGTKHFKSANASSGVSCKGGLAKVTDIYSKGKHPYHLINEGGGCTVYGWVDAEDVSKYTPESTSVSGTVSTGSTNDEKVIWNFLMDNIGNAYGVAGLMGNLYAESALKSSNLQQSYEKKLGYTDDTYTASVDNGTYSNFVKDSAGYGLAQWTYWSRKQNLLSYAKSSGKSIGDLLMQLNFLIKELTESYKGVLNTLKTAKTVKAASDAVLTQFERPADQSDAAKNRRASYGQTYYDKFAEAKPSANGSANAPAKPSAPAVTTAKVDYAQKFDKSIAGEYKVTATGGLHIRTGASTSKTSLRILNHNTRVSNYGYYSVAADGTKWLYVKLSDGLVGFCSSKYLKKC